MPIDYNLVMALIAMIFAGIVGLCSTVWWLSNQFRDVRSLVYKKFDEMMVTISSKLEYHERHDDQRFQTITNDLWSIRVRNAEKDGMSLDPLKYKDN